MKKLSGFEKAGYEFQIREKLDTTFPCNSLKTIDAKDKSFFLLEVSEWNEKTEQRIIKSFKRMSISLAFWQHHNSIETAKKSANRHGIILVVKIPKKLKKRNYISYVGF